MNPELEYEILDIMEKYDISYDDAYDRYMRKQKQMELAFDRQKAGEAKTAKTRQKQRKFKEANDSMHG